MQPRDGRDALARVSPPVMTGVESLFDIITLEVMRGFHAVLTLFSFKVTVPVALHVLYGLTFDTPLRCDLRENRCVFWRGGPRG